MDEEKSESIKIVHRKVFETINQLTDVVDDESILLDKLHLLDVGSWNEIIEERYLSSLCGYPTCSSSVEVQNFTGRRFKIDRREKKVYTAIPQYEKFCSTLCYEKSCHLQHQLYEEPLWFNLDRKSKEYSLEMNSNNTVRRPEEILIDEADKLLLTRLNEMKIADNEESSSENEEEDEEVGKRKAEKDDENFVSEMRSFITSVAGMTKKSNSNTMGLTSKSIASVNAKSKKESKETSMDIQSNIVAENLTSKQDQNSVSKPRSSESQTQQSPTSSKMTEKQMEEKLTKLRQKYGKDGNSNKKITPLIDAPKMDPEKAARLPENLR